MVGERTPSQLMKREINNERGRERERGRIKKEGETERMIEI